MRGRYAAGIVGCILASCGTLVGVTADRGVGPAGDDAGDGGGADDATFDVDAGEPGCDARFCSDFDPPFAPPTFEWTDAGGGGTLSAASDFFVTSPSALALTTSDSEPVRYLVQPIGGSRRIQMMVRIEATSGTGAALQILHVTCGAGADTVKAKIGAAGTPYMTLGSAQSMQSPLPKKVWLAFVLELRADATALTTPLGTITVPPCASPGEVHLGSNEWSSTTDTEKFDVRLDEVRFR